MHILPNSAPPSAVRVRKGCKSYGNESVLNSLDMDVPVGVTYALLGSSGCGKTTLLSSIVGLKRLSTGSIKIFGDDIVKIGTNLVGYMPQESGLHSELKISEQLHFFGRLYGLNWTFVEEQIQLFLKLFELPGKDCLIQNLSGGETRRVSLAVALLHKPKIIVLDEPTVGVDPLLRQNIWRHLYNLVKEEEATIILSTHYTEEAAKADVVSVMRNGRLLVEENPSSLLDKFGSTLLEEVVVKLCRFQEINEENGSFEFDNPHNNNENDVDPDGSILSISYRRRTSKDDGHLNNVSQASSPNPLFHQLDKRKTDRATLYHNLQIIYAMFTLNVITFARFPLIFVLVLLLPMIQCIICWAVYRVEPHPNIGFVNYEQSDCYNLPPEQHKLGCQFISFMIQDGKLVLHYAIYETNNLFVPFKEPFPSEVAALEAVHRGQNHGYLIIPRNFSANAAQRFLLGQFADMVTLDGSSIPVHLDLSNHVRNFFLLNGLSQGYKGYAEKKLTEATAGNSTDVGFGRSLSLFNINKKLAKILPVETNWYDKGAMLTVTSFIMIMPTVAGITIVWDKRRGVFPRIILGGGSLIHLLMAALGTFGILYLGQIGCVIVAIKCFGVPFLGSSLDIVILNYGQSLIGLTLGILLGLVLNQEVEVIFCILGFFMMAGFTGSGLSALESLDYWTRCFVISLPTRLASVALENILFRGWNLVHPGMWWCFLVQGAWILSGLCLTTLAYYRTQSLYS